MILLKEPIEATAATEKIKYQAALINEISNLKRERRNLMTEKIKLEAELVSVSMNHEMKLDEDAEEKLRVLETQLQIVSFFSLISVNGKNSRS
jgi:hypothetical protein